MQNSDLWVESFLGKCEGLSDGDLKTVQAFLCLIRYADGEEMEFIRQNLSDFAQFQTVGEMFDYLVKGQCSNK